MSSELEAVSDGRAGARTRILDTAYRLFSERSVRDVGIHEVIAQADVANATLYRHFKSKDDLVLAFLERREQLWTREWLEAGARARGSNPEEQLLAIFDLFDEWFQREDYEACSFVNVLLEMGSQHPLGKAASEHLANIRSLLTGLAEEAGLRDPASFAHSCQIVMKGSIVAAAEGDSEAAQRAKALVCLLIGEHRPRSPSAS